MEGLPALLLVLLGLALVTGLALAAIDRGPDRGPGYTVAQVQAGLARRPRAWVGRTVWVRGRAAITAAIAGARNAGTVIEGITTLTAEADGNIGYTVGTVNTNTGRGIMLLALKRDESGSWKISAEAYFAR